MSINPYYLQLEQELNALDDTIPGLKDVKTEALHSLHLFALTAHSHHEYTNELDQLKQHICRFVATKGPITYAECRARLNPTSSSSLPRLLAITSGAVGGGAVGHKLDRVISKALHSAAARADIELAATLAASAEAKAAYDKIVASHNIARETASVAGDAMEDAAALEFRTRQERNLAAKALRVALKAQDKSQIAEAAIFLGQKTEAVRLASYDFRVADHNNALASEHSQSLYTKELEAQKRIDVATQKAKELLERKVKPTAAASAIYPKTHLLSGVLAVAGAYVVNELLEPPHTK